MFDTSPDMILLSDLEGNIVDVNSRFVEYTGYSKEDFIGNNFRGLLELTNPEALELMISKYEEIMANGYSEPKELLFNSTDGVNTWINFQGRKIELGDENLIEIIVRDITERMEAQKKLKEAFERENFLKNLLNHCFCL